MNTFINSFKNGLLPSEAMKVAAVFSVAQSVLLAYHLLTTSKVTNLNEKRVEFLFDIVSRNTDKLEEFDIIALRELGLIKETS